MRETTVLSTVLRCRRPSTPICSECNPNYGDYNFYLYAYVARFLEHHMEKAKTGNPVYHARLQGAVPYPRCDHIRIFTGGGETRDRTCRFIDETHFETSGGYSSALYHICEFAERLEQTHGSVIRCVLLCRCSVSAYFPHPGS